MDTEMASQMVEENAAANFRMKVRKMDREMAQEMVARKVEMSEPWMAVEREHSWLAETK